MTTWVSNPSRSHKFRTSASDQVRLATFVIGVT